jgi:hypothetical protein
LLSTGNLARDERVSLFLMDDPGRRRLTLLGHARVLDAREHPALVERLTEPTERARVEPLQRRIAELEARLAAPDRVEG